MKKIYKLTSVFLAAAIAVSLFTAMPTVTAEESAGGDYYTVASTCDTKTGSGAFTNTTESLYGTALYLQTAKKVANQSVYFDNLTAPAGTKYIVFWCGQKYVSKDETDAINSAEYYLQQKIKVLYRNGNSESSLTSPTTYSGSATGVSDNVYTVSTDDGTVRRRVINGSSITGSVTAKSNWGSFKNGYIIMPVSLMGLTDADFADEKLIDLRIQFAQDASAVYLDNDGNVVDNYNALSPNTQIIVDNVGFITDAEKFLADIGTANGTDTGKAYIYKGSSAAYKMNYLAASGDLVITNAELFGGDAYVSWNGEESGNYIVNLYNNDGKLARSENTTGNSLKITGLLSNSYQVQVLKTDDNSKITAASELVETKTINRDPLAPYYTVANTCNLKDGTKDFNGTVNSLYETALYYQANKKLANKKVYFGNLTAPKGTKYVVFWFGQEYNETVADDTINNSEYYLQPKIQIAYRNFDNTVPITTETGYSYKTSDTANYSVYTVSTDDGMVRSRAINGSAITGSMDTEKTWGNFKNGYFIVPIELMGLTASDFENAKTVDLRIQLAVDNSAIYLDKDGNVVKYTDDTNTEKNYSALSPNTRIIIDNVGFITDVDAFIKDCGTKASSATKGYYAYTNSVVAYKMNYLASSGDLNVDAELVNEEVSSNWGNVEGTSSYLINIYNKNNECIYSEETTELSADVTHIQAGRHAVQILAKDTSGNIISVSKPYMIAKGDLNGDGVIDLLDLVRIKKRSVNETLNGLYSGDVDGDGESGDNDIVFLRKVLLGIETVSE